MTMSHLARQIVTQVQNGPLYPMGNDLYRFVLSKAANKDMTRFDIDKDLDGVIEPEKVQLDNQSFFSITLILRLDAGELKRLRAIKVPVRRDPTMHDHMVKLANDQQLSYLRR